MSASTKMIRLGQKADGRVRSTETLIGVQLEIDGQIGQRLDDGQIAADSLERAPKVVTDDLSGVVRPRGQLDGVPRKSASMDGCWTRNQGTLNARVPARGCRSSPCCCSRS